MAALDTASVAHMLNAHEDRIQRLETVTTELASSVAEQNATMKAFSQQMRMMSDSVVEKLEDVSTRLSDKIGTVADVSKDLAKDAKEYRSRLEDQRVRIDRLEKGEHTQSKINDWSLKVVYSILTASAGAGLTLLLEWFKNHH